MVLGLPPSLPPPFHLMFTVMFNAEDVCIAPIRKQSEHINLKELLEFKTEEFIRDNFFTEDKSIQCGDC